MTCFSLNIQQVGLAAQQQQPIQAQGQLPVGQQGQLVIAQGQPTSEDQQQQEADKIDTAQQIHLTKVCMKSIIGNYLTFIFSCLFSIVLF